MSWKRKLEKSWGRLGMRYKLSDICSFRKGKVEVENLNTKNYISTENMLPNKCGIIEASSLPSVALTQEYKNGDILVSNIRPYFKKIWKAKYDGGCSNDVLVFVAKSNTDRNFLYYVLANDDFFTYSMTTSKGTKMPRGDKTAIMQYEVPMIDLQTQKKIASILKSFDEKIELNNVTNNNLEQQMRALFNEFLLVNHFNSLTTVEDAVLTANTGADAIQKAPIVDYDTGVRCIRVGDMTNNRSFHAWGFTKVTDDVFKRYQLHKDDIVVTRTASIGLNTIIAENLSAVYNNGLIRLTVNHSKILPLFLYRQFQTVDFTNYIARIESETSVRPNMKINYLLKYEFVLPPMDKQKELIDLLAPMLNQQNALITESKHLENLRDTLLPKLMSGEIDVSDIEI